MASPPKRSLTPDWLDEVSSLRYLGAQPLVELARAAAANAEAPRPRRRARLGRVLVIVAVALAAAGAALAYGLPHAH